MIREPLCCRVKGALYERAAGIPATHSAARLATARRTHSAGVRDDGQPAARLRWTGTILASAASPLLVASLGGRAPAGVRDKADERRAQLLDDKHPAVRTAATRCLPRLDDPHLVALVLDRLPTLTPLVRASLTVTLRELLAYTLPAVLGRLERPASSAELETWINVLEVLGAAEAFEPLARHATHASAEVRLAVARALKRQFHMDASDVLARLLDDVDCRCSRAGSSLVSALVCEREDAALATAIAIRVVGTLRAASPLPMGEPEAAVASVSPRE